MKATPICTVEGCERAVLARGFCNTHYSRWWATGTVADPRPKSSRPAWLRVLDRSLPAPNESGCIEFLGGRKRSGHGIVSVGSRTNGTKHSEAAHRVIWEHHHGDIPDGMVVRHKCDNPPCVNIDHLELGTLLDNNRDRVERGRCAKGERGRNKLTADQVQQIRARVASGEMQRDVAREFGIGSATTSYIVNHKTWRHV